MAKLLEMHVTWPQFDHLMSRMHGKSYEDTQWDIAHRDELPAEVQKHLNGGGRVALIPHLVPPQPNLVLVDRPTY